MGIGGSACIPYVYTCTVYIMLYFTTEEIKFGENHKLTVKCSSASSGYSLILSATKYNGGYRQMVAVLEGDIFICKIRILFSVASETDEILVGSSLFRHKTESFISRLVKDKRSVFEQPILEVAVKMPSVNKYTFAVSGNRAEITDLLLDDEHTLHNSDSAKGVKARKVWKSDKSDELATRMKRTQICTKQCVNLTAKKQKRSSVGERGE
ncbi:hypothetical protein EAG_09114 [Camponotus floridanus]|uniref:Uncharacterized protein n=1 Tax=Camponotus floridanus TaxID=104421 RepID=E2AHC3_CAMFO|nr:hypothetical protein EAG_09114 [Camponotus floridanus]